MELPARGWKHWECRGIISFLQDQKTPPAITILSNTISLPRQPFDPELREG